MQALAPTLERFVERLQLPHFHPETGIRLHWRVSLCQKMTYDKQTGQHTRHGLAYLEINQLPPSMLRDTRVYKFNWRTREIEVARSLHWQG